MGSLQGRAAFVTGGGRGIGRAIALRLAAEGADVAINYCGRQEDAQVTAESIRSLGRRAEIYRADIADAGACAAMCERAVADFPHLDILVNNAGISSASIDRPTVAESTEAHWDLLLGVNLRGVISMCRGLAPQLRRAPRSDVIMISSAAAQIMGPRMGVYAVSKAALEALAHTLAKEERDYGMRVNIIAPGWVDTEMGRELLSKIGAGAAPAAHPFGETCTPEDIAGAVVFFCSADGRYISGQRLTVAGG